MKGNTKLMTMTAFAMISLLAMPILTLNLQVKAQQAQNQTSPLLSQVQKKLGALVGKFRELVTKSDANITLPQSGNLTEHVQKLSQSSGVKTLSTLLPQLLDLGINQTGIKQLQTGKNDLPGLVQKFGILADLIP